jgi:nitrogen fixation/metabolism regulation signal transduction histidine kinase
MNKTKKVKALSENSIQKMKKNSNNCNKIEDEYSDRRIEMRTRVLDYFFIFIFSFLTLLSILIAIISNL